MNWLRPWTTFTILIPYINLVIYFWNSCMVCLEVRNFLLNFQLMQLSHVQEFAAHLNLFYTKNKLKSVQFLKVRELF